MRVREKELIGEDRPFARAAEPDSVGVVFPPDIDELLRVKVDVGPEGRVVLLYLKGARPPYPLVTWLDHSDDLQNLYRTFFSAEPAENAENGVP